MSKSYLDAMDKEKRGTEGVALGRNRIVSGTKEEAHRHDMPCNRRCYLLPFALLCVWQSIWQLEMSVAPPLDQAVT